MATDPQFGSDQFTSVNSANRLISEKSPYLLQHAHNPVDWRPWGEEAFEAAAREDKPVFLSVGYSTCHWCHVMAHESFEDPQVADLMNQAFVCIKVDREERPDIDQMYMRAAQAMTGRGGWPLTIIMTAEKKPFFAATYIPRSGSFGQAGMMEIIPKIKELWEKSRDDLLRSADQILDHLRQGQALVRPSGVQGILGDSLLKKGYEALESIYDPQNGGFGAAPKFPAPHNLFFLLRYWKRSDDAFALGMVESTLQSMRMGGIYDQIGFGFHRYSTDGEWSVPHFEKMLYDQALMAIAYTEAYQATGKEEYSMTAREILEYVRREMTAEEGGFFSAEDADSEGEEGRYYLWSAEELKGSLNEADFRLLVRLFDIHESGNFEKGMNILRERSSLKDAASVIRISEEELRSRWEGIRARLLARRNARAHPQKDDKILADWNGLMIAALAKAAQALNEPKYAERAKRAADFILKEMRTEDGGLLHRYREGAAISAYLDDYAFLVWGLIDLYETLFDVKYLLAADQLNRTMMKHFWDDEQGGLFFTSNDSLELPLRDKSFYDGAIPSGNSVAMQNLLRLMHLTGETKWGERAQELALASGAADAVQPLGFCMLLSSLDYALGPSSQIAIAGRMDDESTTDLLTALRSRFLPNKSVLLACGEEIGMVAPFTRALIRIDGESRAYVCTAQSCHPPASSPVEMMRLLER